MKRDQQRSRVYKWEDSLPLTASGISSGRRCSLKRCRELVDAACDLYNLPKIYVDKPINPRQTYAAHYNIISVDGESDEIRISKQLQRQDIALHEAAHYVTLKLWPRAIDHGPEFVRVYMHLMHELLGAQMNWLESWARYHGVRFSTHKIYSPGEKTLSSK